MLTSCDAVTQHRPRAELLKTSQMCCLQLLILKKRGNLWTQKGIQHGSAAFCHSMS